MITNAVVVCAFLSLSLPKWICVWWQKNYVNSKASSNIKWRNTMQWNSRNNMQNTKIPPKVNGHTTEHNIGLILNDHYKTMSRCTLIQLWILNSIFFSAFCCLDVIRAFGWAMRGVCTNSLGTQSILWQTRQRKAIKQTGVYVIRLVF